MCLEGNQCVYEHLHYQTAKRETGFNDAGNKFWRPCAELMKTHGCHIIAGDFDMCLFEVVPQLAAHGITVQLAAWYCWEKMGEAAIKVDSCGIFVRGGGKV